MPRLSTRLQLPLGNYIGPRSPGVVKTIDAGVFQNADDRLMQSGAGGPNGIITSHWAGQRYLDTTNKTLWFNPLTGNIDSWGQLQKNNVFNVIDYGADPLGIEYSTTAIQAATTASAGLGIVFFPPGTYKITAVIDGTVEDTAEKAKFVGSGVEVTKIVQHTDNIAIFKIRGPFCRISDITLDYNTPQEIGNTGANSIEFFAVNHSVIERLSFHNCVRGLFIPQEAAPLGVGANWVFSTSFRNLYFQRYSKTAVDLQAYLGGISGNTMENLYINGRDDAGVKMETEAAVILTGWSNGHLSQINVESTKPTEGMYFNTCDGLVFNGIHFEGVEVRSNNSSLMHFAGGRHVLNNVDVTNCQITVADLLAIVRASSAAAVPTKIKLTGLTERDNTVTTTNWRLFSISGDEDGVELYGDLIRADGLTDMAGSSSLPSVIKRIDFTTNHLRLGTQNIISGAAAPVAGTWVAGDIVFDSTPASGNMGWVCIAGGTPGTWKQWGAIRDIIGELVSYNDFTVFYNSEAVRVQ